MWGQRDGDREFFSLGKRDFPLTWTTLSFHRALATKAGKGHHKWLLCRLQRLVTKDAICILEAELILHRYNGILCFQLVPASKQLDFTACPWERKAGRELRSSTEDKQVARKHPQGISCGLYYEGWNLGLFAPPQQIKQTKQTSKLTGIHIVKLPSGLSGSVRPSQFMFMLHWLLTLDVLLPNGCRGMVPMTSGKLRNKSMAPGISTYTWRTTTTEVYD